MHRRRRPRILKSSTGIRTVEVNRGANGFGFTISGQKPCILSCIVTNSPADSSGLRAGDFLISVNGMNVSKYPHEAVVNLIGNATGLKMMIAENYYSDSSDDDANLLAAGRYRPRYHRTKLNRISNKATRVQENIPENALLMDITTTSYNVIHSPNASVNADISNVSAMVRTVNEEQPSTSNQSPPDQPALEYRAIVGYLGTIEMPKQMATSSVTTCIRKMKQEKRNPSTVLMTILPSCLNLKNMNNIVIATYPAIRLNYVSSSSENDNKYFALVTLSGFYADGVMCDASEILAHRPDVVISNSCHIFMVDTKLVEHSIHMEKADLFKIECTNDPISNICLEFPTNSEYVVNLIRSMYSLKSSTTPENGLLNKPSPVLAARNLNMDVAMRLNPRAIDDAHDFLVANSPQPSNHSEITTSSNSDSGIGFHNDCRNISDRILVVDFPGLQNNHIGNIRANLNRPLGIIDNPARNIISDKENSLALEIPEIIDSPKYPDINIMNDANQVFEERPIDVPKPEFFIHSKNSLMTSSCDAINSCRSSDKRHRKKNLQLSVDDISRVNYRLPVNHNENHVFLEPKPVKKNKKACLQQSESEYSIKSCDFYSAKTKLKTYKTVCAGYKSEPDLRFDEVKQIQNASPFRRWGQSSLRRENYCNTMRRPTSLVGSENDVYAKSMEEEFIAVKKLSIMSNKDVSKLPTAVITWGTSFEKLLDDSAGLCAFSEFLRKEFATENIYFWTACERYRRMQNDQERSKEAQEIFAKHMGVGALEPVNVDSKARILAQENLSSADPDLFAAAQKQIFNLMKFDSYQRFIKSDLYKSCLEAEAKNLPLPFSAEKLDPILRTTISTINSSKLKKSLSNAEDRRRKSLLPWHRKTRCKSKDRSDENNSGRKESTSSKSSTLKLPSTNSVSDVHSSRSSLSSLHYDPEDNRSLLCRVILSNGATTVAQTRSNETIHELVERLLEKRGIVYNAYEAFINGSSKPLDINGLSTSLSGKEVLIEQRVVFKLDLPNRKVISVKSKASKALGDVLRPILHKYNYQLDFVQTFVKDNNSDYPLDIGLPVTCIDGQRIFIVCREDDNEDWQTQPSPIIATSQHQEIINHFQVQAIGNNKTSLGNHQQQNTLDEITNKVFNELLQGKVDSSTSAKSEDYGSETSSGIFGRLRRRDANAPAATRKDNLANIPSTTTNDDGIKKPLIAKWKAGVKLQVTTRHQKSNDLLEGLTRAQRRLEDQRGTEINFELPDFLKNKENFTNQSAKLRIPAKRNELLSNEYDAQQAHNREKEHEKPQPAPRLSITKNLSPSQLNRDADLSNLSMKCLASPVKSDENEYTDSDHTPPLNNSYNSSSLSIPSDDCCQKAPPPLPPKPRIVPIKPSNWNSKPYLSNTSSFV